MRVLILILSFLFAANALLGTLAHAEEVYPGYTKLSPVPNSDYFMVEKCEYTPGDNGCILLAHLTKAQVIKLKNEIWWSALGRDAVVGTLGAAAITGAAVSGGLVLGAVGVAAGSGVTAYYIHAIDKATDYSVAQKNRRFLAKQLREALKSNKPLMFMSPDGISDLLQDYLNSLLKTHEQYNFSNFQVEAP